MALPPAACPYLWWMAVHLCRPGLLSHLLFHFFFIIFLSSSSSSSSSSLAHILFSLKSFYVFCLVLFNLTGRSVGRSVGRSAVRLLFVSAEAKGLKRKPVTQSTTPLTLFFFTSQTRTSVGPLLVFIIQTSSVWVEWDESTTTWAELSLSPLYYGTHRTHF